MRISVELAVMTGLLLLPLAAAQARAGAPCWRAHARVAGREVDYAEVAEPAGRFTILREPRRFGEVVDAGVVVANGTFFGGYQLPLGAVIVPGAEPYAYPTPVFRTKDGRWVDLRERWGIGVLASGRLALSKDKDAPGAMSTYLGGGGLLLRGGADESANNWGDPETPGPDFPLEYRDRRAGRTVLGIKEDAEGQRLLVVEVPRSPGMTVPELPALMRALGATDAVFYDGGGAAAFAAGPPGAKEVVIRPSNPGEDLNPTHIIVTSCP